MKKYSFKHKIVAILLGVAFVLQSLTSMNSHTHSTGVDSYHYSCGCFGCLPTHLAVHCNLDQIHY